MNGLTLAVIEKVFSTSYYLKNDHYTIRMDQVNGRNDCISLHRNSSRRDPPYPEELSFTNFLDETHINNLTISCYRNFLKEFDISNADSLEIYHQPGLKTSKGCYVIVFEVKNKIKAVRFDSLLDIIEHYPSALLDRAFYTHMKKMTSMRRKVVLKYNYLYDEICSLNTLIGKLENIDTLLV